MTDGSLRRHHYLSRILNIRKPRICHREEAKMHVLALVYSLTMPRPLGECAVRAVSSMRTESVKGNMRVSSESMNV